MEDARGLRRGGEARGEEQGTGSEALDGEAMAVAMEVVGEEVGCEEGTFREASGARFPQDSPAGTDRRRRPDQGGAELLKPSDPLQELELGAAPAGGEEGLRELHPMHQSAVGVVQPVVGHAQIQSHHRRIFCALSPSPDDDLSIYLCLFLCLSPSPSPSLSLFSSFSAAMR
jgi:hypothetical protein